MHHRYKFGDRVIIHNLNRYKNDPNINEEMPELIGLTATVSYLIRFDSEYMSAPRYHLECPENREVDQWTWDERWLIPCRPDFLTDAEFDRILQLNGGSKTLPKK